MGWMRIGGTSAERDGRGGLALRWREAFVRLRPRAVILNREKGR